jgi:Uncharacterised nucleotidyltransferase
MHETHWLEGNSPAFRLMIATSWLAPDSWQKNQEECIREAIRAGPDWTEYVRLVDRHGIPALSWAALQRAGGQDIPGKTKQELQERSEACRLQAVRHSLLLAEILKAFRSAEIPVMVLKGPILSFDLYGDLGLRQCRDLDLAVSLENISRARPCLGALGWHLDSSYFPMTPRQWERLFQTEHHLGFVHSKTGCFLELHWRNHWDQPDQTASLWKRSVASSRQGCSYQAMDPVDQALFLCSHGGTHAWFRAKWLGDLARIHAEGRLNWDAVLARGLSIGQEKPVLSCLQLLQIVYKIPLPRIQGDVWRNLSPFLVKSSLHALGASQDPASGGALNLLYDRIRRSRYDRLVQRGLTWRQTISDLAYYRGDFELLRLPDRLFWAYAPLRPFLWIWRSISRSRSR